MPGFSTTFEGMVLAGYFGFQITENDVHTIALFTAVSNVDTVAGTEVSGGSYARATVTWGNVSGSAVQNDIIVTFPTATANWGTITHFAIRSSNGFWYTAATPLTVARTINSGDTLSFPVGSITIGITS